MGELARQLTDVVDRVTPLTISLSDVSEQVHNLRSMAEDIHGLREEFRGFGDFRTRIEGYEATAKRWIIRAVATLLVSGSGGLAYFAYQAGRITERIDHFGNAIEDLKGAVKENSGEIKEIAKQAAARRSDPKDDGRPPN